MRPAALPAGLKGAARANSRPRDRDSEAPERSLPVFRDACGTSPGLGERLSSCPIPSLLVRPELCANADLKDAVITSKIKAALAVNPITQSATIHVDTDHGIVNPFDRKFKAARLRGGASAKAWSARGAL